MNSGGFTKKISLDDLSKDSSEDTWADDMSIETFPQVPMARMSSSASLADIPDSPPYIVVVKNLPFSVSEHTLETFFAAKPRKVELVRWLDGRSKGFAFAEFETFRQLQQALSCSGQMLGGRTVSIALKDHPKETRPSGQSGSFSFRTRAAPAETKKEPAASRSFSFRTQHTEEHKNVYIPPSRRNKTP